MDKKEQERLLTEIMQADEKDGLYKQQTALDWLSYKLKKTYDDEGKLPLVYTLHLIEQAKQMEKAQIIEAWLCGDNDGSLEPKAFEKIAEEYYNETYNK